MRNYRIQPKGILFDLDGTVFDTRPAYIETAELSFKVLGQNVPGIDVALEIPKRLEQKLPLEDIVKGDINHFKEIYLKTFYSISARKAKPFLNVAKTLDLLFKKNKLAMITMRFVSGLEILNELRQFCLDKYFDHVLTALDTHQPKPSPEALIKAATQMDLNICDCIIVGDSVIDVKAGKAAGAQTISVLSGLYSKVELEQVKPDFIITDVSELPILLK